MLKNPVIYDLEMPVSSLNVTLQGSGGDLDVSGFIYSPEGGTFSSGAIDGGYSWEYKFILMSPSEDFTIRSFDSSGNVSPETSKNINYILNPPLILSPGIPKVLSDSFSSSASTFNVFDTLEGDFLNDGIIVGDYVLGTSGKNSNILKKINQVNNTFLITEMFPYSWSFGDSIKIFSGKDRPSYKTNKLKLKTNGTVDSSAQKIIYTTEDNFDLVKVYANLVEPYNIDESNNLLKIEANGVLQEIYLTQEEDRSAESIVNEINSYFDFNIAYLEQISSDAPFVFFLQARTLNIYPSSACDYFLICKGDFSFAKQITIQGNVVNVGRCEVALNPNANRNLNLNIDSINLQLTLPTNETITPSQIAADLNNQAGKCVASPGPNGLTLIAENNIDVLNDVELLNLKTSVSGTANLNNDNWNLDLDLFGNNTTVSVAAVDAFGDLTDLSSLEVNYQIDPPTLSDDLASIVSENTEDCVAKLPVEENVVTLSGSYDEEGLGVLINGESVFSESGNWTVNLSDLAEGDNQVVLNTVDKFGNLSEDSTLGIPYTNPQNQSASEDQDEALEWSFGEVIGGASAENIRKNTEFITNIVREVSNLLKGILSILKVARSFIQDNVLSFVNKIRKEIQKFINDVVSFLKDLANGAGIYLISTIPRISENTENKMDAYLKRLRTGGSNESNYLLDNSGSAFDGFVQTLVSSFDDPFDSNRPQFGSNIRAGGYALAAADTNDALSKFLRSLSQISALYSRELVNFSYASPRNIRVLNENKRVVLTWETGQGFLPGRYVILRSTTPGGDPKLTNIKNNILKRNASRFSKEEELDKNTGKANSCYEVLGFIAINSLDVSKYQNAPDDELGKFLKGISAWGDLFRSGIPNFRFIDGTSNALDRKQKLLADSLIQGPTELTNFIDNTAGDVTVTSKEGRRLSVTKGLDSANQFLDKIRDGIIYQQSSTEKDLENGKTFYYKIVSDNYENNLSVGQKICSNNFKNLFDSSGFEISGSPTNPFLDYVEEELIYQFDLSPNAEDKGLLYKLSGSVFNNENGLIDGTGLKVFVDNQEITRRLDKVYYDKGIIRLKKENTPKFSVVAKYWTKKAVNTTRAKVVGRNSGSFQFKKDDYQGNNLILVVGDSSLLSSIEGLFEDSNFKTQSGIYSFLNKLASKTVRHQTVTFVRDFGSSNISIKTAEEVASIIREQTSGIRVSVNRENKIVLMDDLNSDPVLGSKIIVCSNNSVLGFEAGDSDSVKVVGQPPDWVRLSMLDMFPILGDVSRYIEENSQNFLRSLEDATQAILDFIDTLIKKVETLNDIIEKLKELIESLVNILSFQAGFWYLKIPSKPGGNEYLKQALLTSTNRPRSDFAAGFLIVYGDGGTQKILDFLFKN